MPDAIHAAKVEEGQTEAEKAIKELHITDAVVLSALSAFAYTGAYFYERGFAEEAGIPLAFIDLRWTTVLTAMTAVGLSVLGIALMSTWIHKIRVGQSRIVRVTIRLIVMQLVFSAAYLFVVGLKHWRVVLFGFVGTTLMILGLLILASVVELFETKRPKPEADKKVSWSGESELTKVLGRTIPTWAIVGFGYLSFSVVLAGMAGQYQARSVMAVLTTSGSNPLAVVRIYGDKIVVARLDRRTGTVEPIYRILPLTDSARVFTMERSRVPLAFCRPMSPGSVKAPRTKGIRRLALSLIDPATVDAADRCSRRGLESSP